MHKQYTLTWIQAFREVAEMTGIALIVILLPVGIFLSVLSRREIFGLRSFVVLTGSMEPTIPTGSIIVTKEKSEYVPGDIVTFENNNKKITHRIISKNPNGLYVTKGDANASFDSAPIAGNQVIGQDVILIPSIGSTLSYAKRPIGFLSFILVPGFFIVLSEILVMKREWEKEIEKKVLRRLQAV